MKCCAYCLKIFANDKYKFCPYCGGKARDYNIGDWRKEVEQSNIEYYSNDKSHLKNTIEAQRLEMPIFAKCPDCGFKYMNVWKNTGVVYCGNCVTEGTIAENKYKHLKG